MNPAKQEVAARGLVDLGWLNSGLTADGQAMVDKCRAATPRHHVTDVDVGPPHRGIDHVVTCNACGYVYHYDSSD